MTKINFNTSREMEAYVDIVKKLPLNYFADWVGLSVCVDNVNSGPKCMYSHDFGSGRKLFRLKCKDTASLITYAIYYTYKRGRKNVCINTRDLTISIWHTEDQNG